MSSGNKWSTFVDYFLILSSIIGVGFASGKEICVFFYDFGGFSLLGLMSFTLLYIYLFWLIDYIRIKLELNSYSKFNKIVFGRFYKITNIAMLVNFVITAALMTSGADYIFSNFLGVGYRIPSFVLTILGFVILLGGIGKIRTLANIIIPILISVIVINSIKNVTPTNVNFEIVGKNAYMAIYYGLLFGVNNFIVTLPVLFQTKKNFKIKFAVILCVGIVILCNLLVFASNDFVTDMPMLELSKNVSGLFYYIYFFALCIAIFSTFIICLFNTHTILTNNKKSVLTILLILIINFFLSSFGYNFLVNHFYLISSLFSALYVVVMLLNIAYLLIFKKKSRKK